MTGYINVKLYLGFIRYSVFPDQQSRLPSNQIHHLFTYIFMHNIL